MHNIEIGPLLVTLQKTVKVKNNQISNLPPSLGIFDIYKVADYNCPKHWDQNAFFIAMYNQEAMWLLFSTIEPVAVMIGAGAINAINGKSFENKLEKDGYLVTPPTALV